MRFEGQCYRGHDPAWSFTPLSGEGAAITGGGFNRKGEPTLYSALDGITALLECTQGLGNRLLPLTMCEYDVDCDSIADLRDDKGRAQHGVALADLACGWLGFLLNRREAPSWVVVDRLKAEGHAGMLVPSFAPGATAANSNLVLWNWGPDLPHKVDVYDPTGRLPKDQTSWSV